MAHFILNVTSEVTFLVEGNVAFNADKVAKLLVNLQMFFNVVHLCKLLLARRTLQNLVVATSQSVQLLKFSVTFLLTYCYF